METPILKYDDTFCRTRECETRSKMSRRVWRGACATPDRDVQGGLLTVASFSCGPPFGEYLVLLLIIRSYAHLRFSEQFSNSSIYPYGACHCCSIFRHYPVHFFLAPFCCCFEAQSVLAVSRSFSARLAYPLHHLFQTHPSHD